MSLVKLLKARGIVEMGERNLLLFASTERVDRENEPSSSANRNWLRYSSVLPPLKCDVSLFGVVSFLVAQQTLSIVVIGASGDLAKKKTYPSLLNLFESCLLPEDTVIWGYARSAKTHQELRNHLRPHLIKTGTSEIIVNDFLDMCYYHAGKSYGDEEAYTGLISNIRNFEANTPSAGCNRLFYLAVPPNVFGESGLAIKKVGMSTTGWTRVVIEKPFGRDLDSCNELLDTLATQFDEENLYRVRTGRRPYEALDSIACLLTSFPILCCYAD